MDINQGFDLIGRDCTDLILHEAYFERHRRKMTKTLRTFKRLNRILIDLYNVKKDRDSVWSQHTRIIRGIEILKQYSIPMALFLTFRRANCVEYYSRRNSLAFRN